MIIGHSVTDKEKVVKIISRRGYKVYFIGIGGISMSSLAEISAERGAAVFGSDIRRSASTAKLEKQGIRIKYVQNKSNVLQIMPDIVVYSLSISPDNPEYVAALAMGITTVSRAEYLGALMEGYALRIGVSGSHGKSTTTAMLASVLSCAGEAPSVLCGAGIADGGGYISGDRDLLVYEACEYGDSFLRFSPSVQLMLNLELDHTDYFSDIGQLRESFLGAASRAERFSVVNADDENLRHILPRITSDTVTYSLDRGADFRYEILSEDRGKYSFALYTNGISHEFTLGVPGRFNAENAVGVAVTAISLGIPVDTIGRGIAAFSGIPRRMQLLCRRGGTHVFYDYAHHPGEIRAVADALGTIGYKSICALFAPHTYSRTKAFLSEFADALSRFCAVYVTDIYGAREQAMVGVSSASLADAVRLRGTKAYALASSDSLAEIFSGRYDCLVLMGAGDLDMIKKKIEDM